MKYSLVALVAATVVVATPQHALEPGAKINCAKANANYCMGADIILRCDDSATGTQSRCDNSGACVESNRDAGDASCKAADGTGTARPGTIETSMPPATNSPPPPPPTTSDTGVVSIPEGTGTSLVGTDKVITTDSTSLIGTDKVITDPTSMSPPPIRTSLPIANGTSTDDGCPPEPTDSTGGQQPTGTDGSATSAPTAAGAPANKAMGSLAFAGVIAAFFL